MSEKIEERKEELEEKKDKKRTAIFWLFILILFIIVGLLIYLLFFRQRNVKVAVISDNQQVLDTSAKFKVLNKEIEEEYIELMGYGLLEIDASYPNIYLENPTGNNAYLSFDVVYNGKTLYSSNLIEPGNMEAFNIYECLDAGEHTLSYIISAYHIPSLKTYWTGVEQIQEIRINK